ncbi:hypothetical protein L1887_58492 [Cichorium endivia]|nr:hypothetical protein L1887_58492 [Cichorium endivia]
MQSEGISLPADSSYETKSYSCGMTGVKLEMRPHRLEHGIGKGKVDEDRLGQLVLLVAEQDGRRRLPRQAVAEEGFGETLAHVGDKLLVVDRADGDLERSRLCVGKDRVEAMQAEAARILAELGAHAAHLLAKLVAPLVERLFVAHGLVLGLLFGEGGGSALGVSMVARDAVELGALCHPTATGSVREARGRRAAVEALPSWRRCARAGCRVRTGRANPIRRDPRRRLSRRGIGAA